MKSEGYLKKVLADKNGTAFTPLEQELAAEILKTRPIAQAAFKMVDIWNRSREAQEAGRADRNAAPLPSAPPRWEETAAKHALVRAVRDGV